LPAIKKIEDFIKAKNVNILRESGLLSEFDSDQEWGRQNMSDLKMGIEKNSLMAKTIHFTGDFQDLDMKLKKLTRLKRLRENSAMSDTSKFDTVGMK
jgi:hypothetical protein